VTDSSVSSACRAREYVPSVSSCESTLSAITTAAGSSFWRRKLEQPLVVLLLRVQKDQVEHVVDRGQGVERIALDEVRPILQARISDVRAPGGDLVRVVLQRQHAAAQVPDAGREPDRRVAARAADLQHLAVRLRSDECEQELPCAARDLT
jgi:hypothetical protein